MSNLPELELTKWRPTLDTLHLYAQIVGKIRMHLCPFRNHWWHLTLYVSAHGLTTRLMPYKNVGLEIEFNFIDHQLEIRTSEGKNAAIKLSDGLSVAKFYQAVLSELAKLDIHVDMIAKPYGVPITTPFAQDEEHASYDRTYVERYWQILLWTNAVFEEFAGRYRKKTSPVQLFWHSFDLALTRFTGRPAPPRPGANKSDQEAYSDEVISFGFWAGDDNVPAPAFYSYTAPEPTGLTSEPLQPAAAKWTPSGGMALLMYDDVRAASDPKQTLLAFCESAFQAGAKYTLAK